MTEAAGLSESKRWLRDIATAAKREKDYRKEGKEIKDIYDGKRREAIPFNILYANTSILSPALYGNLPRPIVQRRFKGPSDNDPVVKAAAEASTRMAAFLLDTNSEEYDDFNIVMKGNVLDAALPGRGLMEFCYEAETVEVPVEGQAKSMEQFVGECVYPEPIQWNRYCFGYAKQWKDVPWVAFELYFDKTEAKAEFGPKNSELLKYLPEGSTEDREDGSKDSGVEKSDKLVACVYKVWDKKGRRVLFVSSSVDDFLKEVPDPYELTGFYPFPEPLRFVPKSDDLIPTALYSLYENQAKELNRITTRINKLIDMLKIRGVYDSSISAIEQAMKGEDGDLQATGDASTMARDGGLEKHIWLVPIDKIIGVIQQLYIARQSCKQVIYEITGLADIMRGASQASETLGAQELKAQWGGLRLKDLQKIVQNYARGCIRILLEIAINKFQPETWAKVTGLPYLTPEQAVQAKVLAAAQAQQARQTGQQPPPPPPPQVEWTAVLSLLKDKLTREYTIDIETNSTIDPDAGEAKKGLAEMMNAISQFLNGVAPLVLEGALPMDAAKAILLGIVRQYEMGSEVEDYIRQMQMPPKKPDEDKSGEQKLAVQLQAEKDKNTSIQRAADLDVRELKLQAKEADMAKDQEIAELKLQNMLDQHSREVCGQVEKATTVHQEKVRGMVDGVGKRVEQVSKKAETVKGAQDAGQQTRVMGQVTQMQSQLLEAINKQSALFQTEMATLLKALSAPKTIQRGPDGRATGIALAPTPVQQ